MTARDITTPEELVASWEANEISAWSAIAVVLHRADASSVPDWVMALPLDLQQHLVGEATSWGPVDAQRVTLGRGAGLDERPEARPALREWLRVGDRPERWLSPEIVARVWMDGGHPLPRRFVARALVSGSPTEERRSWSLALQQLAPPAPLVCVALLRGGAAADELQRGASLDLYVGGERVGGAEILLNAGEVRDGDPLSALDAVPRLRAA